MSPASRKITHTFIQPPINPKAIRQQLRTLIQQRDPLSQRDPPRQTHVIVNEIWQFVEYASFQLHDTEPSQALLTLQAVTDVSTDLWMHLNDIHGEVSSFFQNLASIWTEALLSVDLTARERTHWTKQITTWQTRLGHWSIRAVFDAPLAAIREGWDDISLQHILKGISLQPIASTGEMPPYAPVLTQARLTVLEQREQLQEYLRLAKATGQTKAYVTMLVHQGQIIEAVDYGLQHLATVEDAFALAQELFAHGEHAHSLHIADHGLTLKGNLVPLATWLRDQSWSVGEQILALKAGEVAFQEEPTLKQYLRVAAIAGADWPKYRAKFLDAARQAPWTADPQGLVQIFLHEHLFDDAIAVLKTKQKYTLVAQVVEAALNEQAALEWVTQECHEQAAHIMNGAKAAYYQGAALWLTRARTAYHLLRREEEWNVYLNDLLERHKYKSKLLPLLTVLAKNEEE